MSVQPGSALVPGGKMPPSTAGQEARRYFPNKLLQILIADQLDVEPRDFRFDARADQGVELVLEPIQ